MYAKVVTVRIMIPAYIADVSSKISPNAKGVSELLITCLYPIKPAKELVIFATTFG